MKIFSFLEEVSIKIDEFIVFESTKSIEVNKLLIKVKNLLTKVENLSTKVENLSIQFKMNCFHDQFDVTSSIELSGGDNLGDNN